MTQKKVLIGLVSLLLLLSIGYGLGKKFGWLGNESDIKVATEKSTIRSITETVSASGKIQPETEVKISADVSGEITDLLVKEGDKVKQGQLLLRIRPDLYQSAVERLEAALNTSKANSLNAQSRLLQSKSQFENIEALFKRNEKLYEQKVISQQEYDASKAQFEVAKAEIVSAEKNVEGAQYNVKGSEAALKEAKDNLGRTSIYSPVDGTISKLNVEKGERVVGTSQMAGTEILKIANLNEMEVKVDVNENDIVRVSKGDTAEIEVDAYLGKKFTGIVTSIANSANVSNALAVDQVTNFEVKVRILRESYSYLINKSEVHISPFRPGMSATVDIKTEKKDKVLSVPIQAVTTRIDTLYADKDYLEKNQAKLDADKESGKSITEYKQVVQEVVFVVENGKSILKKVSTGIQDGEYIEILSGLFVGEEIVFAPYNAVSKKLKDGSPVQVKELKDLYNKEEKSAEE